MRDVGNRARVHGCAVHDGRIELRLAFRCEDGPARGIEERVVFKNTNRRLDGIERRASAIENRGSGFDHFGERGAIGFVAVRSQLGAFDVAGAAVNHDRPVAGWLRLSRCPRLSLPPTQKLRR